MSVVYFCAGLVIGILIASLLAASSAGKSNDGPLGDVMKAQSGTLTYTAFRTNNDFSNSIKLDNLLFTYNTGETTLAPSLVIQPGANSNDLSTGIQSIYTNTTPKMITSINYTVSADCSMNVTISPKISGYKSLKVYLYANQRTTKSSDLRYHL